jgi:hypothetical protein
MFPKFMVVGLSILVVLAGSEMVFNSRDANEDPREFIRKSVLRARNASKAKWELSRRGNHLRQKQDLSMPTITYPIPLKHADKFMSWVFTTGDGCNGDPISGYYFPLNVCQGFLDEGWSYMTWVRDFLYE